MNLKITNLKKNFGERIIFDGFSYCFKEHGIYALAGDSGVGKTTLLRIIAGLDKDFDGNVEGGGIGRTAFAFQEYRLFSDLTALENVFFANCDRKNAAVIKKAEKMLSLLGFSDRDMELYPNELSGGMKQRVSLARAFIAEYPILLLDEPTKELDPSNSETVRKIIRRLSQDRLVILVSHSGEDLERLSAEIIEIAKR